MFFPERIKSIRDGDVVLEVGPGGTPFWRSDVLLEKRFDDAEVARIQRGCADPMVTDKEVVYYSGGSFPFSDRRFDYVICSHVLEHVPDVPAFLAEVVRVARGGYFEFPTVYYDYIYNIPGHVNLLFHDEGANTILFLPKAESGLEVGAEIQRFFFETTFKGYVSLINDLKPFMFQGFEWAGKIESRRAGTLQELTYDLERIEIPAIARPRTRRRGVRGSVRGAIAKLLGR